jgi:hypothetical protein
MVLTLIVAAIEGFNIDCHGRFKYHHKTIFWACPMNDHGVWNIYKEPIPKQNKCVQVALTAHEGPVPGTCPLAHPSGSHAPPPTPVAHTENLATQKHPSTVGPYDRPAEHKSVDLNIPGHARPVQTPPAHKSCKAPGKKPGKKPDDKEPAENKPVYETTCEKKPSHDKPPHERPAENHPVHEHETTCGKKPSHDKPPHERPAEHNPVHEHKTTCGKKPSHDKTSHDKPAEKKPPHDKPSHDKPSHDKPAHKPADKKPEPVNTVSGTPDYEGNPQACPFSKPNQSKKTCPVDLKGPFEFPHLIVPVDQTSPSTSLGNSYFGKFAPGVCSIFNFDVAPELKDSTCSLLFLFPELGKMETSSYNMTGSGNLYFFWLEKPATQLTTWENKAKGHPFQNSGPMPLKPGKKMSVYDGACPAGHRFGIQVCSDGDLSVNYFQDSNPEPIGLYIRVC